jgi:G3E family GTPase
LIFGVDSKLFLEPGAQEDKYVSHTDEIETITIYSGSSNDRPHAHKHHHATDGDIGVGENGTDDTDIIDMVNLTEALVCLSKESVWRVKGFVKLNDGVHILNWAFGRFDLTKVEGGMTGTGSVRFTVMGERGEVKRASRKFAAALHAEIL